MYATATLATLPEDVRRHLLAAATRETTAAQLALAGVISMAPQRTAHYRMPIAGLSVDELIELINSRFPAASGLLPTLLSWHEQGSAAAHQHLDEFDDLIELLTAHQSIPGRESHWVACAIATASMADNHLWQDLGLPNRGVLNTLMLTHFTTLKLKNAGDMKWKKFFYRQMCIAAEVPICKSPNCALCRDYWLCFGAEE